MTGCTMKPGDTDLYAFEPPVNGAEQIVVESGNDWGFNASTGAAGFPVADDLHRGSGIDTLLAQGLKTRWRELVVADTDPIEAEPLGYGVELIHKTGTSSGSSQVVSLGKGIEGSIYTLMLFNDSDTGIDFDVTGRVGAPPVVTVSMGQVAIAEFACISIDGGAREFLQTRDWYWVSP